MKALTVLQPWAGFILTGEKHIETRGWNTNIRSRVAIHAGASKKHLNDFMDFKHPRADLNWQCLELSCILGTVEIVDCVPLDKLAEYGYCQLDTVKERSLGDWSPGRYGFILQNPILFDKPIDAKGKQGWWNWNLPGAENGGNNA